MKLSFRRRLTGAIKTRPTARLREQAEASQLENAALRDTLRAVAGTGPEHIPPELEAAASTRTYAGSTVKFSLGGRGVIAVIGDEGGSAPEWFAEMLNGGHAKTPESRQLIQIEHKPLTTGLHAYSFRIGDTVRIVVSSRLYPSAQRAAVGKIIRHARGDGCLPGRVASVVPGFALVGWAGLRWILAAHPAKVVAAATGAVVAALAVTVAGSPVTHLPATMSPAGIPAAPVPGGHPLTGAPRGLPGRHPRQAVQPVIAQIGGGGSGVAVIKPHRSEPAGRTLGHGRKRRSPRPRRTSPPPVSPSPTPPPTSPTLPESPVPSPSPSPCVRLLGLTVCL